MDAHSRYLAPQAESFLSLLQLPELAGYHLEPLRVVQVRDIYLDTAAGTLLESGYFLRIREQAGEALATLKPLSGSHEGVHRRLEVEALAGQAPKGWAPILPDSTLRDRLDHLVGNKALQEVVQLQQHRTPRVAFEGARLVGVLSFDVVVQESDGYPVVTHELEVELASTGREEDLCRLAPMLRVHSLQPTPRTKFERALLQAQAQSVAPLWVLPDERQALEKLQDVGVPLHRRRARVILLVSSGARAATVANKVGLSTKRVRHWIEGFRAQRMGVFDADADHEAAALRRRAAPSYRVSELVSDIPEAPPLFRSEHFEPSDHDSDAADSPIVGGWPVTHSPSGGDGEEQEPHKQHTIFKTSRSSSPAVDVTPRGDGANAELPTLDSADDLYVDPFKADPFKEDSAAGDKYEEESGRSGSGDTKEELSSGVESLDELLDLFEQYSVATPRLTNDKPDTAENRTAPGEAQAEEAPAEEATTERVSADGATADGALSDQHLAEHERDEVDADPAVPSTETVLLPSDKQGKGPSVRDNAIGEPNEESDPPQPTNGTNQTEIGEADTSDPEGEVVPKKPGFGDAAEHPAADQEPEEHDRALSAARPNDARPNDARSNDARPLLAADEPVLSAASRVLGYLYGQVESAVEHFHTTRSPESTRRLLVSAHRIRIVFDLFEAYLPPRPVQRLRRGLGTVARALDLLSERDLVVAHLSDAREDTSAEKQDAFDAALATLQDERARAAEVLAARLSGTGYMQWHERFQRLLAQLESQVDAGLYAGDHVHTPPDDFLPYGEERPPRGELRHMIGSALWEGYEALRAYDDAVHAQDLRLMYPLGAACSSFLFTLGLASGCTDGAVRAVVRPLRQVENHFLLLHHADAAARALDGYTAEPVVGLRRRLATIVSEAKAEAPDEWDAVTTASFREAMARAVAAIA